MAAVTAALVVLAALPTSAAAAVQPAGVRREVSYDGRALIMDGTRRMLFSGEMHYTRSTPEMWPSLIAKAKEGGLDVIQTYVFWNVHEPLKGQYNFMGRYDLVKFIKEIQAQGLYVSLRIGPFIEAEWKYGGFPFWLHDVPNITFRSDNEPFKQHMQRFVTQIVNMMKHEGLYYPQGGPIIISQIENEYQMVEPAFRSSGPRYVRWAAAMAVSLQTGVPWMMCKQDDAPDPVKIVPATSFLTYGSDTQLRSPEGIAFAVALFIARKKGSFVNYYMYHGGTNFGRFASAYITTSYYDGAPLDEYGLIWQPTWGHLRELHAAVKQSSEPLLFGKYSGFSLGQEQEAHVFETESKCVAFLVNFEKNQMPKVTFRHISFQLAPKSISILSDCRRVVYETAKIKVQYGSRTAEVVQSLSDINTWKAFKEPIPLDVKRTMYTTSQLLEQLSATKDETDYLWYTVSHEYRPIGDGQLVLLNVESRAHIVHAFLNNQYVALYKIPDIIDSVTQTTFATPAGNDAVALNLAVMGKGEVWINGESIGRYWVSFKAPSGNPSQSL
ncbi:Beta-galactosidase 7 [Dichanthelium oligosanthes]|uniref:beta-galactosidase n=1 Tax=Dichanthelium oligosanthes TaxID=888268 RepID=A0A1E5VAJ2_9POAL|nr:Beta-galactosidase 7 [Dichanthelium oligosanthes]